MSTEIKNTLFSFVTMRAPELFDDKNSDIRFVRRKEGYTGPFDDVVAARPAERTKWQAMAIEASTFQPLSEIAVKDMAGTLFCDLAVWIAKNKYTCSDTELTEKLLSYNSNVALDGETLWNNLFYQVVTQKDFYAKEMIMQILLAYHVYEHFDKDNPKHNRELINAKVVLPESLFADENTDTNGPVATALGGETEIMFRSLPDKKMEQFQQINVSNIAIERHQNLKKELKKVEKIYQKEYSVAYNNALADYKMMIQPDMDAYQQSVANAEAQWCGIRNPEIPLDPANPCDQPTKIPFPELPEFEFKFRDEIDLSYMSSVLSEPAYDTLLELLDVEDPIKFASGTSKVAGRVNTQLANDTSLISYGNVFEALDDKLNLYTDQIIRNTAPAEDVSYTIGGVVIGGSQGAISTGVPFKYQICPKVYKSEVFQGTYVSFDLTFRVPDTSWYVTGVTTVSEDALGNTTTGEFFLQSQRDNAITLGNLHHNLLKEEDFLMNMRNFSVTIRFSNGAERKFTGDFGGLMSCANGSLTDEKSPVEVTPAEPNIPVKEVAGNFIPKGFGVKQLGIADYKKVEQSVQGYVEGEVAAIENVMAREFKEKATRRLRRSEITETTSSEREKEQLTDTTSTERFEMQSEVAKVLQETKDKTAGATFNSNWKLLGGGISLGANASMATHTSKQENIRQSVNQAKEITERAMERVVAKVKEERIEKIIDEFEENNKHGFDNTQGDKHVVGVYRWVDKVYKNQIRNYGKRLMFEFMIPEPSKLHFLAMFGGINEVNRQNEGTRLVKPTDPRTFVDEINNGIRFNIKDYSLINETTVKYWGSVFNVELPKMPPLTKTIGKSFAKDTVASGGFQAGNETYSAAEKLEIPEGYYTKSAQVCWGSLDDGDGRQRHQQYVGVGNLRFTQRDKMLPTADGLTTEEKQLKRFVGEIPIAVHYLNITVFGAQITIELQRTDELYQQWQKETFKAIIDAYEDARVEFEQRLAEEREKEVAVKESNPDFYRQIENMVLRKNCISYLIDQNPSARRTYGKDMAKPARLGESQEFGNYEINVSSALDDYTSFVKFMEQAFEWELISYNFYPYYWGNRADWNRLYQQEYNDPLFRSFMQAGMARVVVTVRPGFEDAVSYYMQTGQIWSGGEVPVIEDKLFLSIVDELKQPEGEKEGKAWATRVPTALTILQADSIGLKVDKALPFDEDLSDFEDAASVPTSNNFEISTVPMNGGTA